MRGLWFVVAAGACSSLPPETDDALANPNPLREVAGNFAIGTAIDGKPLATDSLYGDVAAYQFNMVVAETKMKMASLQPTQGNFDWTSAQKLVDFATEHGMQIRGHTLVYPHGSPGWLLDGDWSAPGSLEAVMTTHIQTVMQHYAGQVVAWDVVNEPLDENDDGTAELDNSVFRQAIGDDYIDKAMVAARAADPTAKLFINESGCELPGAKLDAMVALASRLHAANLIDGVGFEFHIPLESVMDDTLSKVAMSLQAITDLGLEVHITELDIRIAGTPDADALARQATVAAGVLHACRTHPECTAFLVWGFTDRYSWIPDQFPGYGSADLLDDTLTRKPMYDAVQAELQADDAFAAR